MQRSCGMVPVAVDAHHATVSALGALFEQYHYTGRTFDDELSERSLETLGRARLQPDFLQADVDAFRAKYSDRLDDLNDDPMELGSSV